VSVDPYGFPTAEVHAPRDSLGPAFVVAFVSFLICAGCTGLDALLSYNAGNNNMDHVGIFVMVSWPACVAFATGVSALFLHVVSGRWWLQVGPNLLIGGVVGTVVWFVSFVGVLIVNLFVM
jgi:hypothetical protein